MEHGIATKKTNMKELAVSCSELIKNWEWKERQLLFKHWERKQWEMGLCCLTAEENRLIKISLEMVLLASCHLVPTEH